MKLSNRQRKKQAALAHNRRHQQRLNQEEKDRLIVHALKQTREDMKNGRKDD